MKFLRLIGLGFLLASAVAPAFAAPPTNEVCVVVGLPGDDAYAPGFTKAVQDWQDACKKADAACTVIGLDAKGEKDPTDHDLLQQWIAKLDPDSTASVWIVYLGHGTFDSKDARLNIRGPDVTAAELAGWLKPVQRQLIFIDGGSASAPFINALSAPNRIIITATQTGREVDYARLGERLAENIISPDADIDQDGQTSVLEAFVTSAQQVQDFYIEADRMATEHALIDDNGDKRGTPADWFQGTRVVKQSSTRAAPDGDLARVVSLLPSAAERALTDDQRAQRAQLEQQLVTLRAGKSQMSENDYYIDLERVLRQLAAVYAATPASSPPPPAPPAATPSSPTTAPTAPAK